MMVASNRFNGSGGEEKQALYSEVRTNRTSMD